MLLRLRVLIIEDDEKTAQAIRSGLEAEGYEPRMARTGDDGWRQLSAGEVDLVVLDWMVPGLDGLGILRALRGRSPRPPVLLLTARDTVEDRVVGLDAGADDYLVKPFAYAELLARIRALLRRAASFTAVSGGILIGLLPIVSWRIGHRLELELDRQLAIDWKLIEAHLEPDGASGVRWKVDSPATPESGGYADTWFDVWDRGRLLMSHWPVWGGVARPPAGELVRRFDTLRLETGSSARALEQAARIGGNEVLLRVFRDATGLRRTQREILAGFALTVPLVAVLSALGGYWMAGWTLRPIRAMTAQARRITSESLGERLPNPNPDDELGRLAAVINETLQRLEDSFESLRRFTADASHELRTPLTAMRAVGEVALRGPADSPGLRDTLGSMLEEVQRLNDLTDSLLLLARVEGGRWSPQLEPVHVATLIRDVVECLEVLALEKGQTLALEVDPELMVTADRMLLRQAVMNILHNAIRYSPPGSRVTFRGLVRDGAGVIAVQDEGPGIAPEHRGRVFERFYRVESSRARGEGGAGLGLAIAKSSVELLGGRVELRSEPGRGCCFEIVLPRCGRVGAVSTQSSRTRSREDAKKKGG